MTSDWSECCRLNGGVQGQKVGLLVGPNNFLGDPPRAAFSEASRNSVSVLAHIDSQ